MLLAYDKPNTVRKITYDEHNQYRFYVLEDYRAIRAKPETTYYWYLNRKIHENKGYVGNLPLHGPYEKFDKQYNLLEVGRFKLGKKDSIWITFNKKGVLTERFKFKKGMLNGKYESYTDAGEKFLKGTYKNGIKTGRWIDFVKQDTVYYYKGVAQKEKRNNFAKRVWIKIFPKKVKNDSLPLQKKTDTILSKKDVLTRKQRRALNDSLRMLEVEPNDGEYEIIIINGKKVKVKK